MPAEQHQLGQPRILHATSLKPAAQPERRPLNGVAADAYDALKLILTRRLRPNSNGRCRLIWTAQLPNVDHPSLRGVRSVRATVAPTPARCCRHAAAAWHGRPPVDRLPRNLRPHPFIDHPDNLVGLRAGQLCVPPGRPPGRLKLVLRRHARSDVRRSPPTSPRQAPRCRSAADAARARLTYELHVLRKYLAGHVPWSTCARPLHAR
jgi:hypothetical protein